MFQLQQSFRELDASVQKSLAALESSRVNNPSPVPMTEPKPSQQTNPEIQPGQFVQYVFKDEAQVELLSAKRI
jgi:hypothetical protein